MKHRHLVDLIALILLIVGGLNCGIVGLFSIDVLATIFGDMAPLTRILYVLIGLSAVYRIAMWAKVKAAAK